LEQPALLSALPSLSGKRVLDIGCGTGGFCREAVKQGVSSVLGMDISKLMCAEAVRSLVAHTEKAKILNQAIEDAVFQPDSFDVVVSSLTLHYVADFAAVISKINQWLSPNGAFVFSVNHPIYTAGLERVPDFGTGVPLTLSLERYQQEGIRRHYWFVDGVVKYHRTLQTHFGALLGAGFKLGRFLEPQVLSGFRESSEELRNASRRPVFMIISAVKE
jgi:2-polyprenyl-3-methyl-5-hydroxy-6-metoxy-1,4-benzoquinol methylase